MRQLLERVRGAFSTDAPDAVLAAQLHELRGQLPVIYAGMAFCSIFVALTFFARAPVAVAAFELAFLAVAVARASHWRMIDPTSMSRDEMRGELRNLLWMSIGLGLFCSLSAFIIDPMAQPDERIALVLWVAYCGVGSGMSLAVFKPASRVAMTLAIIPYAAYVALAQPGTGRVVALIILVAIPVGMQQYGRMADFFRALTLRNMESLARNRDAEERRRAFLEAATDWAWETDAEERITYVSGHFAAFVGAPARDFIGLTGRQFVDRVGMQLLAAALAPRDAVQSRTPYRDAIYKLRRSDGAPAYVSTSAQPRFAEDGSYLGFIGWTRDVTSEYAAQIALREGEQRFRDFAESASDWFWEADEALRYTFLSDRASVLTGVDHSTVYGATMGEVDGDVFGEGEHARLLDALARRAPFKDVLSALLTPDGTKVWVSQSGVPVFRSGGAFAGYRGVCRNVTAQIEAQREVEESRRRLAETNEWLEREVAQRTAEIAARSEFLDDVIESMADGLVVFDHDFRIQNRNRAAVAMSGLPAALWADGKDIRDLLAIGVKAGLYEYSSVTAYFDAMRNRIVENGFFTATRRQKDGRVIAEQIRRRPHGGYVVSYSDITELKRHQEDATARTELLNEVFESMAEGVLVLDESTNVVVASRRCADLSGTAPELWHAGASIYPLLKEAVGKGVYGNWTPETYVAAMFEGLARDGAFHTTRQQEDGRVVAESVRSRPRGGLVITYHDITDLKAREQQLERITADLTAARDAAEAGARAKAQFLANMSHEIRTPMNGVIGMASLLLDSGLSAKQREMAQVIVRSGDNLLMIINDILDFSRLEAGKMAIVEEPFDLRAIVEDVAALLALKVQEKGLELMIRYAPDLGADFVGDAGRIRQAVTNLVGNAVKFTDAGHVLVCVSGRRRGEIADVEISVEDTGCGIPAEKLDAIFQAFEQADGSAARRHDGTGLGLAITRRLVEAMNGVVVAESMVGAGSTFRLRLPIRINERAISAATQGLCAVEGLSVLVVDDNKINRDILVEQLGAWGLTPVACDCAEEAMKIGREAADKGRPFSIAILDHQMPGEDGVALSRRMRAERAFEHVPLILLTSAGHKGDPGETIRSLFDAYLVKPARASMFFDAIVNALGDRARAESGRTAAALRSASPKPPAERAKAAACAGVKVLVAEDNIVNQMVIAAMLDTLRCEVRLVSNGVEAVEAFIAFEPDVVLMDISMPEMDGPEASLRIRALEQERGLAPTPIIGVTAHAMKEDRQRCLDAGMDDHLPKPVKQEPLTEALIKWTAARRDKSRRSA